jgi:hypothetical protein
MNHKRGRVALAIAPLLVTLGAVGCGGETVDSGQMEEDLRTQLSDQAGVNAEDVSVDCPDDQDAEEGNKFDCTLTAPNGDEVTVNVTITNGGDSFEAEVPQQQFK